MGIKEAGGVNSQVSEAQEDVLGKLLRLIVEEVAINDADVVGLDDLDRVLERRVVRKHTARYLERLILQS